MFLSGYSVQCQNGAEKFRDSFYNQRMDANERWASETYARKQIIKFGNRTWWVCTTGGKLLVLGDRWNCRRSDKKMFTIAVFAGQTLALPGA